MREYPTLREFDVPEADIVAAEPLPIATAEEAPTPFIEVNSNLEVGFERVSGQGLTFHKKGGGNLVQSCPYTIQILYQVCPFLPLCLCLELIGVFFPWELDETPPCIQDNDQFNGC